MNIRQMDDAYVAHTYARFPVELVRGKGSLVWDAAGKQYIDLGSGIAVNGFGISDDAWLQAVTAQLQALPHASNLYYTEPCARLAQMLCERTGMKRVFFGNSGAEANECLIKAARKYAAEKHGPDCYTIEDFCADHPMGLYVLGTGTHVVTVVDGNYYDTWRSGDEIPQYYWEA